MVVDETRKDCGESQQQNGVDGGQTARISPCDILPRLKARASHPVLAEQVNPDS